VSTLFRTKSVDTSPATIADAAKKLLAPTSQQGLQRGADLIVQGFANLELVKKMLDR
jgi:hypothetical protein